MHRFAYISFYSIRLFDVLLTKLARSVTAKLKVKQGYYSLSFSTAVEINCHFLAY